MPIEPRQLLDLAKRLVGPTPGADEADLRRGISTAYYALFHLLIKDAMASIVADPEFRPRVGRTLQHGKIKAVCVEYNAKNPNGADQPIRQVAAGFVALHQAREQADYDDGVTVQHTEALSMVQQAESAFQAWLTAQDDPVSLTFLQDLFFKNIKK